MKHYLLIWTVVLFQIKAFGQSDYVFWFNKGDCSNNGKPGIFIDTLNTVDIEYFDSLTSTPDSISFTLNSRTQTLGPRDHYELKVYEPGTYKLYATVWSNNQSFKIDTAFNAVFIPELIVKYRRGKNKKGEEIILLNLFDSDSNQVDDRYFSCFTDINVYSSSGDLKFSWGGQLSLNLSRMSSSNPELQKGDIIEFTHLRLLMKSINRSFWVSPRLRVEY